MSDDSRPAPTRWASSEVPRGEACDARFERLRAAGMDLHGEADFVSSFEPRRVLDAGCRTGRVAIELARRDVDVVGVDVDAAMLDAARRKAPGLRWVLDDLSTFDVGESFDVVVAAGNVIIFLASDTHARVLERMAAHLAPGGRLVAGFQLQRGGYSLTELDDHCAAAGLTLDARFATWDRAPWRDGGDYAVSVHRLLARPPLGPVA